MEKNTAINLIKIDYYTNTLKSVPTTPLISMSLSCVYFYHCLLYHFHFFHHFLSYPSPHGLPFKFIRWKLCNLFPRYSGVHCQHVTPRFRAGQCTTIVLKDEVFHYWLLTLVKEKVIQHPWLRLPKISPTIQTRNYKNVDIGDIPQNSLLKKRSSCLVTFPKSILESGSVISWWNDMTRFSAARSSAKLDRQKSCADFSQL